LDAVAGVSTKILSKSPFFDAICALSISGVEQQSKQLRKAENQLKTTTVPDFGFGSSLKADQHGSKVIKNSNLLKGFECCPSSDHGFHCQKK
jgi:hypothetical protein